MSKTLIILIALVGGILLGVVAGTRFVDVADVIGTLWLNGLRMTVVPLVVALLITGIAQTADAARAGRLAGRAVLTMLVILWSSSILAALMMPVLLAIFPMPEGAADALKVAMGSAVKPGPVPPFGDFVRAMVPTNPIAAASADAVLPLMIFTAAFAFAALRLPPEKRKSITGLFDAIADAMVIIINWVLAIAPIGVFALAFVVGAKAGTAALGALAHYVFILSALGVVIWLASFVLAVLGARRGLPAFFKASAEAQAVAISTQSSLASLPAMLAATRKLGVREATADFVLPMAVAIFRATSPAMNMGVAIYAAYLTGTPLSAAALMAGVFVAFLVSLSSVSLPGTISFVISVGPIAMAMGVPIAPLALLVAVKMLPDIMRTLGNVTLDVAVTTAVDRED